MSDKKLYSDDKLLKMVNKILDKCKSNNMKNLALNDKKLYTLTLKEEYEDFSYAYPGLFNLIIDDPNNFDMNRLIHMLNMKKKVENNETTYETASSQIGQEYYDEFVKPNIDEEKEKNFRK